MSQKNRKVHLLRLFVTRDVLVLLSDSDSKGDSLAKGEVVTADEKTETVEKPLDEETNKKDEF